MGLLVIIFFLFTVWGYKNGGIFFAKENLGYGVDRGGFVLIYDGVSLGGIISSCSVVLVTGHSQAGGLVRGNAGLIMGSYTGGLVIGVTKKGIFYGFNFDKTWEWRNKKKWPVFRNILLMESRSVSFLQKKSKIIEEQYGN